MTQQKGATTTIMLGTEASYKTIATAGFVLPVNDVAVVGTQSLQQPATITGNRNPVTPFAGNRTVEGPITLPADSVAMWYWLEQMFGSPGTTGADPYVHEFKVGSSMGSFSLEETFTDLATDLYTQFLGCKIARWSMTIGGDGELVSSVDIIGASESHESSSMDGSPTTVDLARVDNFSAALTEGGVTLANATEVSFNIDFGLDPSVFCIGGSGIRSQLPAGIVSVGGTLTTLFEDDSLLTKAAAETESALKITITESASSVLEIEFQEIKYERNSASIPGPQGLLIPLNFLGYYDDGSESSSIVVRLTNSEAHA